MNEDEEDPVVSEMPVFLAHTLEDQLYLIQHPTRPAALPPENDNIIRCCFKPDHQELLMELSVDTENPNYDTSHGEQIAINVDGGKKPTGYSLMDKRTLQSTRVVTDTSSCALATLKNRQMFIVPLKGIMSVQPTFPHLDVTDKRAKEEAKEMGEDVSGGEEEESEKQVTVKFARQESDRVKRAREQSYNYLSKRSAEEKWYQTKYHLPNSRQSEREKAKLTSVELSDQLGAMCLTARQYMDNLVPVQQDPTWLLPSMPSHVTSLTALSNLPLPDIVLAILKEVKIITFEQLAGLLAGQADRVKLLRCVQQVAVLVQGNWVVRSECLYNKESISEHNGVPGEIMCRARDYILYQLSEGKVLERKQVAATVRLPPEELKTLLSQVARLRRNKGWELVLPPDSEFIDRNSEVVERQTRAWASKFKQIMEALEGDGTTPQGKGRSRRRESSMSGGSDLESPQRLKAPPRHRKDSSFSSDTESGTESGRRKRNSESSEGHKVKTEQRKKRNSESGSEPKLNGKSKRTKNEIPEVFS
ncbi:DNA-directed RNA polymerase III subunit RPC5 [Homalodisca vitripennis]|nr:DNA-directed RNA polymerase III subunit RPC5 [Homalodisca vitripennis]